MVKPYVSEEVVLDPEMRSNEVLDFERRLLGKIVGQDRAVHRIVNMYQIYLAGMAMPNRPIGNLLFLGPTGSGKTRIVEASAGAEVTGLLGRKTTIRTAASETANM